MKIYKEDYKHFRLCQKLAWFLNEKNYDLATQLIAQKKIINFVELTNTKTSSKINNSVKIISLKDIDYLNEPITFEQEAEEFYAGETLADGLETGKYAQDFFASKYRCYNFENKDNKTLDVMTTLNDKQYDIFFEARFEVNGCVTKCDILKRNNSGWDLIEVKAVTWVKEEHMLDLLYQYDIVTKTGLQINNVYIMYLNNNYILQEKLDLNELFICYGTTWQKSNKSKTQLALFESIKNELVTNNLIEQYQNIKAILQIKDEALVLKLLTSKYCHEDQKQLCFHIFSYFDPFNTIFQLYRLRKKKKALWYYEENLLSLDDPQVLPFILNSKTHIRQYEINKKPSEIVDLQYLNTLVMELKKYKYPIYMYDFETMKSAIPKFYNSRPYQQIPFQYSVHVLLAPDFDFHENKHIKHYEFLANGDDDPRTELIEKFSYDLLKRHGFGTYVAYNQSFEKSVIKNLVHFMPPAAPDLTKILMNTIDLQDFFKDFKIYKQEFCGSLSIKKTLPAFDHNFSYQDLKISKGDMASEIFRRRVEKNISLSNWHQNFRDDMLKYCARDTLGMVVLFWHVKNLIASEVKKCHQN